MDLLLGVNTTRARHPAENPAGWVPKPRPAEGRLGAALPKRLNVIF